MLKPLPPPFLSPFPSLLCLSSLSWFWCMWDLGDSVPSYFSQSLCSHLFKPPGLSPLPR